MRFYGSGEKGKPVIFLFPGTCCLWTSFDHVLEELHKSFYTVVVSYDGFDPKEKTEFSSMLEECEKIEAEVRKNYGGKIKAAYGCSLGGSPSSTASSAAAIWMRPVLFWRNWRARS